MGQRARQGDVVRNDGTGGGVVTYRQKVRERMEDRERGRDGERKEGKKRQ